jgi:hypothetical protein
MIVGDLDVERVAVLDAKDETLPALLLPLKSLGECARRRSKAQTSIYSVKLCVELFAYRAVVGGVG